MQLQRQHLSEIFAQSLHITSAHQLTVRFRIFKNLKLIKITASTTAKRRFPKLPCSISPSPDELPFLQTLSSHRLPPHSGLKLLFRCPRCLHLSRVRSQTLLLLHLRRSWLRVPNAGLLVRVIPLRGILQLGRWAVVALQTSLV